MLLITVLATLALAGCADQDSGGATPTATGAPTGASPTATATPTSSTTPFPTATSAPTPVPTVTPAPTGSGCDDIDAPDAAAVSGGSPSGMSGEQVEQLLRDAVAEMTEAYDMYLTAVPDDGTDTMTFAGSFDPEGAVFMLICGLPQEAQMSGVAFEEVALFVDGTVAAWVLGDTIAVVDTSSGGGSMGTDPNDLTEIGDPGSLFNLDDGGDVTVTDSRMVSFRGRTVIEADMTGTDEDGEPSDATILLQQSPPRLLRISTHEVDESGESSDPFANAVVSMEFLDGGELGIGIPDAVRRATGLGYKSDKQPDFGMGGDDGSGPHDETWTFWGDQGILLSEVEVHVKQHPDDGSMGMSFTSPSQYDTMWSMSLADGTQTQGTLTLTYDDADGDGRISPGDTLHVVDTSGETPTLILLDTVTGAYVIPGPGVFFGLAALALVALALRRR